MATPKQFISPLFDKIPGFTELVRWFNIYCPPNGLLRELLLSLCLGIGLFILSGIATSLVARQKPMETQRVWRVVFRNIAAVLFVLGVGSLWKDQLPRALVMTLGATAAGLLIAFREAWLSLFAFALRLVKRHYGLGDFIEVDGIRGEVLDITWQHTAIAETGPGKDSLYSGRVVQIPNHRMIQGALFIDNLTGAYGAHVMQLPLLGDIDVLEAEAVLMAVAQTHCSAYYVDANQHMDQLRKVRAIDTPSVEPRIRIRFSDECVPMLVLRIVVPSREKQRIEQLILRDFLAAAKPKGYQPCQPRH